MYPISQYSRPFSFRDPAFVSEGYLKSGWDIDDIWTALEDPSESKAEQGIALYMNSKDPRNYESVCLPSSLRLQLLPLPMARLVSVRMTNLPLINDPLLLIPLLDLLLYPPTNSQQLVSSPPKLLTTPRKEERMWTLPHLYKRATWLDWRNPVYVSNDPLTNLA